MWVSDSLQWFVDYVFPRRTDHDNTKPAGCVLVAMQDDARHFLKAVRRGILGYVLQDASAEDVIAAVRGVARGEAVCPAFLTRVLFDYVASRASDVQIRAPRQFRLTRREQQLVPLVGRGLTNKEIAAELSVSEQTIKSHIHRILRKVGVEDRSGHPRCVRWRATLHLALRYSLYSVEAKSCTSSLTPRITQIRIVLLHPN